ERRDSFFVGTSQIEDVRGLLAWRLFQPVTQQFRRQHARRDPAATTVGLWRRQIGVVVGGTLPPHLDQKPAFAVTNHLDFRQDEEIASALRQRDSVPGWQT